MTPAQLDGLGRVHRRVHGGKGGGAPESRATAEPGTLADMAMFATLRRS